MNKSNRSGGRIGRWSITRWRAGLASVIAICIAAAEPAMEETPEAARPYVGRWAFELPDGRPAWLQIDDAGGELSGNLLWSVGSARPVDDLRLTREGLEFRRRIRWQPYGRSDDVRIIEQPFVARIESGSLRLRFTQSSPAGTEQESVELAGKRMPPLPPAPDLSQVQFGPRIELFNGSDLTGWRLSDPDKINGWRAEEGVLINETPKTDFGAYGDYGNLRTDRDFEDFHLTLEYNVAAGGNSGVYLRGMYEAQVVDRDSRMQGINGPGAIFGRIAPSKNAAKPGGQWNRYELTLVDQHVTVVLNGETVIDNEPVIGCTGGGISADDTQPGPILLQGDHTAVRYRDIVLRERRREPN